MAVITCFGEVLWDVFPTHRKIGGAPLNVASRLQSFNHEVNMISAVGNDEPGTKILTYLKDNNINTNCVQILNDYKTGEVTVTLNKKGADRKSTRLNSSHVKISYAVFCLKK